MWAETCSFWSSSLSASSSCLSFCVCYCAWVLHLVCLLSLYVFIVERMSCRSTMCRWNIDIAQLISQSNLDCPIFLNSVAYTASVVSDHPVRWFLPLVHFLKLILLTPLFMGEFQGSKCLKCLEATLWHWLDYTKQMFTLEFHDEIPHIDLGIVCGFRHIFGASHRNLGP